MAASKWTLSDGELLQASGRDACAFAELYRRHERLVLGWLIRRTPSREDAADLTAETFAAAWIAREKYIDSPTGAAAWLLGIAQNKWRMSVRRGRIERTASARLGLERVTYTTDDLEGLDVLFSDVDDWLAELSEDQRAAVRAHILDGLSYDDVAWGLGITAPTARKRVSRGLAVLRRQLQDQGTGS